MDKPIWNFIFPNFWVAFAIAFLSCLYVAGMEMAVREFSKKTVVQEGSCVLSWDSTVNSITALCPFDREIRVGQSNANIARLASGVLVECKVLTNGRREFEECQ